jgi:two-component system, NarL family, nitrate/nitrite response regulator NarL
MGDTIKIIIADDHPLIRDAIRLLLAPSTDIKIVAEAQDGHETLEQVAAHPADILLLDVHMPESNVMEVVTAVQQINPALKIVVVTAADDPAVFQTLFEAGIAGYVLKDETDEMLVPMITAVYEGEHWYSAGLIQESATTPPVANPGGLTDREIDVLDAIARGMTTNQIACHFELAAQTVRNYTSRIYEKLGLESRAHAILWVLNHGIPAKSSVLLACHQAEYAGIYRE